MLSFTVACQGSIAQNYLGIQDANYSLLNDYIIASVKGVGPGSGVSLPGYASG